ncbi:alpha/beta hydrolases superfamily protein [Tanacetum coccineum]
MIIKKDSEIVKAKGERKSLTLKDKKESSDEECSISRNEDEEYAMANGKGDRKCFRCGDPNHLIGECPKPPKDKNQRSFVGGSWSDSGEEDDEKVKDKTCLVAQESSEVCLLCDEDPKGAKDCQGGNWWDKVGRQGGEERGMMSCLVVRTGHKKMMNSVPVIFERF